MQVNAGTPNLVRLPDPPPTASLSSHKVDATLAADGAAQVEWREAVTGVEASEWRVRFHAEATRKQRVQQMIANVLPGSEITAVTAGDLEDVEQGVTLKVSGKVPRFARTEGEGLSVPLGRREHMVRDFAPQATRKLDVRLYAQWTQEDDWTLRLPPGAKLKSAPVPAKGSGPFGSYSLDVTNEGGTLHVKTTVTLAKTRVTADEYPAFRAWCEQVDRALGQRAVLNVGGAK